MTERHHIQFFAQPILSDCMSSRKQAELWRLAVVEAGIRRDHPGTHPAEIYAPAEASILRRWLARLPAGGTVGARQYYWELDVRVWRAVSRLLPSGLSDHVGH